MNKVVAAKYKHAVSIAAIYFKKKSFVFFFNEFIQQVQCLFDSRCKRSFYVEVCVFAKMLSKWLNKRT